MTQQVKCWDGVELIWLQFRGIQSRQTLLNESSLGEDSLEGIKECEPIVEGRETETVLIFGG